MFSFKTLRYIKFDLLNITCIRKVEIINSPTSTSYTRYGAINLAECPHRSSLTCAFEVVNWAQVIVAIYEPDMMSYEFIIRRII